MHVLLNFNYIFSFFVGFIIYIFIYLSYIFDRFVKGCRPGYRTGFDIDVADLELLEQSHEVIVASAIFGKAAYKFKFKNS